MIVLMKIFNNQAIINLVNDDDNQTSTGQLFKFANGYIISSHT